MDRFCGIVNDHHALKKEQDLFVNLPVNKEVTNPMITGNYLKIKEEVADIIETEIQILLNTPE